MAKLTQQPADPSPLAQSPGLSAGHLPFPVLTAGVNICPFSQVRKLGLAILGFSLEGMVCACGSVSPARNFPVHSLN